jgi:Putative metal-binding motif
MYCVRKNLVLGSYLCALALATPALALDVTTTSDADLLVDAFDAGGDALTITGATYVGHGEAAATYTDGPLGMDDGMLITSGHASLALPPSISGATSADNGMPGTALCNLLTAPHPSYDAATLTVDFELAPLFNGISFQFVFGSEEYPEWVGSSYNDSIGVFLDGATIDHQIAFDEEGNHITINGPFFSGEHVVEAPDTETEYDGSTPVLTTRAEATPGSHQLVVVICDAGDHALDSGAFLTGFNGCVGDDCTGTVPCEEIDDDADGFDSCIDCDDTNADIYPGATEVCNDLDDDCDNEIDEGDVCCTDTDGDGFCDEVDNCPLTVNPGQANADGDLLGDACDDCPLDADNDEDGDGVCGDGDWCPGTMIPEGVPTVVLKPNHFALVDGDGVFDTITRGNGNGPGYSYTIEDTAGCSCEQIIDALLLGDGHVKHGCSISAMEDWGLYLATQ